MSDTFTRLAAALADRYRLVRELGAGGMATVFLAHDLRHERDVAIKVLHPDLGAALGADRFLAEIKVTARLQHPHILPLLDSGAADGLLYYVMPLVTGESLRARLERERQLPVADAVRLAREVAGALEHAHRQGIVHRDIKPENILLQDGAALVADFGIALAVQQAGGQRLTQTGLSLGTPQYMSPEQAMGERAIDARSDVYALGAVTYEMLAGEPPFTGPTVQAIVARLMSEEPRGLVAQRKAIPEPVEQAVLKALEKLPADRFASAAEFAAALDAPATSATRTIAQPRATARASRLGAALGVVALLASVAAVWGWLRPMPAPEVVRYRIVIDSGPAAPEWAGQTAISPDGQWIVRAMGPERPLLVRRRDALDFTSLPGSEGAGAPFFSPDGTQVGFAADNKMILMPLAGGPSVVMGPSETGLEAAYWGQDGLIYRNMTVQGQTVIGRGEARAGASLEQVTFIDSVAEEQTHLFPELLPGGKSLLFQLERRDGRRMLAVADLAAHRHRVLVEGVRARYVATGHLLYSTADGRLWVAPFDATSGELTGAATLVAQRVAGTIVGPSDFAVSATGTLVYAPADSGTRRELVWVGRDGTRTPFAANWKGEFGVPSIAPDGRTVAVALRDSRASHVWLAPVSGAAPPTRLTTQHESNVDPAWSPDGRWVSYLVGASNAGDVWRMSADGSGVAERVLHGDRQFSDHQWAPNGALLVRTTTGLRGSGDVLRLVPGVDTAPRALLDSPRSEWTPTVSPDGRWLAYVSNVSGRSEVYVSPFDDPGSARWAVSTTGAFAPRWSPRGDELFYVDMRARLMAARITTTPTIAVQASRVLFDASDFVLAAMSRRGYDVAPDGQRFLMVRRAEGAKRGELVVVEHWTEELRRSSPRP
ncbi:MAG TPA: protein kinase [Gemmatimonadaceae bacterium]|nr:protein kinase [Gemmatimonadaceae bacterium]